MRLDCFIAKNFHDISRQKAIELIKQEQVLVNNSIITKPSFQTTEQDVITFKQEYFIDSEICYSRAAIKLQKFLQNTHNVDCSFIPILQNFNSTAQYSSKHATTLNFLKQSNIETLQNCKHKLQKIIENNIVLDVGASTGGFTQVLLAYNAKFVIAQDIGTLQLDSRLHRNKQIISIENVDIRDFALHYDTTYKHQINQLLDTQLNDNIPFCFLTCDVSFISLHNILPSLLQLSKNMLLLFKPQYEVGKTIKRNKKGVIKDQTAIQKTLYAFLKKLKESGAQFLFVEKSFLNGKEGNEEFFIFCEFKATL